MTIVRELWEDGWPGRVMLLFAGIVVVMIPLSIWAFIGELYT